MSPLFKNIPMKLFKYFLCLNNMQYCNIIYTDTVEFIKNIKWGTFFKIKRNQYTFFYITINIFIQS